MNPSKNKPSRKKESSVQPRVSRAAEQLDLSAHVAALQEQIATLKALVEQQKGNELQESGLPPSAPLKSPFGLPTAGYPASPAGTCSGFNSPLSAPATSYQLPATNSPVSSVLSDFAAQVTTLSEQISALRSQFSTPDSGPSTQPPVSGFQSQVSSLKSQVSSSIPIYELKETRPVGYQPQEIFDFSSEESQDGFFASLLDRARMQWLMGDWETLSKLDLDQIQHHPDRAKLALLVSAGLMQGGQVDRAKQHLAQAYRWGVPKKLAFSILYSGVRQSLHQVTHGKTSGGVQLNNGSCVEQSGVPSSSASASETAAILSRLTEIHDSIQALSPLFVTRVKNLSDELIRVRKFLDAVINREVKNAARQVQASAAVQHYLDTGDLVPFHLESNNWPISPDFGFTLLQLLETQGYDLIVEFGSGLSTVLVARCLDKLDQKRQGKPPARFLSFDHLPGFHGRTLALLNQAGLADRVELCLAPLADYSAPNGRTYPYYTCQDRLAAFAAAQPLAGLKVLAIIDGPPAVTGEHARYPAGPILAQAFCEAALDILLDDLIREDERQVAKFWAEEFQAAGRSCGSRILKLQKEACLLEVR